MPQGPPAPNAMHTEDEPRSLVWPPDAMPQGPHRPVSHPAPTISDMETSPPLEIVVTGAHSERDREVVARWRSARATARDRHVRYRVRVTGLLADDDRRRT